MPDNDKDREQLFLPPPATCPEDCSLGPTKDEISNHSSFVYWGHGPCEDRANNHGPRNGDNERGGPSSKKRKHLGSDGDRDREQYVCETKEAIYNHPINSNTSSNTSSFRKAIGTFLSSGCCVIDHPVLPPHFVNTCLEKAKADYRFLEGLMEKERENLSNNNNYKSSGETTDGGGDHNQHHHRMVALTRQDYAEWVARDGGRVDIRYGLNEYPYNSGGLIYNSIVFPLVRALLNGETTNHNNDNEAENKPVQLLYAGVMWGMPITENGRTKNKGSNHSCCHHQKWHADGGHLFSPDQLPKGLTLPPHCINVFYPLVDLTRDNGPTEFRIGSHRRDRPSANNNNNNSKVEFPLVCKAGGAVLFDYRIQHRGKANTSAKGSAPTITTTKQVDLDKARPVLYLAYSKTFFKDHGNPRSGRKLVRTASQWATRTLDGHPVPYGKGFENYGVHKTTKESYNNNDDDDGEGKDDVTDDDNNQATAASSAATVNGNECGIGERWILFQMTLELPNGKSEILRVHKGDVAVEVAQQFCFKHGLQDDFVTVLAQMIQGQMEDCR